MAAEQRKAAFIDLLLRENVLQFGDFTLKSGRQSPYFFNLGEVSSGSGLAALGEHYAAAVVESGIQFDVLFGPAYKGIPIATATAVALAQRDVDCGVAFNRKERKEHGEGGLFVGAELTGRVLLVDDVMTAGTAIRQAIELIRSASDAVVAGVVVAMDRQEKLGEHNETALQSAAREFNIPTLSVLALQDVIYYLESAAGQVEDQRELLSAVHAYQSEYCVT